MVHNPGCTGCLTTLPTASYWNKWEVAAHEKRFQAASATFSVANDVWNFLNLRCGSDGRPVASKILKVEECHDGWVKFSLLSDDAKQDLTKKGFVPACHGTRFEALYAILFEGKLQASWNRKLGHSFCHERPWSLFLRH